MLPASASLAFVVQASSPAPVHLRRPHHNHAAAGSTDPIADAPLWGRFSTGQNLQTAWEGHPTTEPTPDFDALLIADYAKGVCNPTLLRRLIDLARGSHIPVIIDPARIADYSRYAGATLLKPIRTETELATGPSRCVPPILITAPTEKSCARMGES